MLFWLVGCFFVAAVLVVFVVVVGRNAFGKWIIGHSPWFFGTGVLPWTLCVFPISHMLFFFGNQLSMTNQHQMILS